MTTVKSLHEDLLYTILWKCSSSIDMWHFLLALDYDLPTMTNLRAFWSHIRLNSLHNKNVLLSFTKNISNYCVDLRIDNLNWMLAADLRRLLSTFRLLTYFHSGNVALSKSTLVNDIKTYFPFLKYLTLLISLDNSTINLQNNHDDNDFKDVWKSLNEIKQLEHISFVLQEKKGGSLSNLCIRLHFRSICEYISNIKMNYKLILIEENTNEISQRFLPDYIASTDSIYSINLHLDSKLDHLILSFRSMTDVNLKLGLKDSTDVKLQLYTLVLPTLPSTIESFDILDLDKVKIFDIVHIDMKNNANQLQLDRLLNYNRQSPLKSLSLGLRAWMSVRLVIQWNKEIGKQNNEFSSVFENCFDQMTTKIFDDDEDEVKQTTIVFDQSYSDNDDTSSTKIDQYLFEFLDDNQLCIFQIPIRNSWLNKLTNLNLTGIHCHSIDMKYIFDSAYLLRSLSLSPCLLAYINHNECHCREKSETFPCEMHSLNPNLRSINLVSSISNMKQICSKLLDQYERHSIRHSSIHQYLSKNNSNLFQYEKIIGSVIRMIIQTLDLHHLSIRIPKYELNMDDIHLKEENHLQTLVLDVKLPIAFHRKLTYLYSLNRFNSLRRLIIVSEDNFDLTPLLMDKLLELQLIEIISTKHHLNRPMINYIEKVLKPNNYPNLNTFRLWVGAADAIHLLKHLNKTVRIAYENSKPGFQFDVSIMEPNSNRQCVLYDHRHEIHKHFHSFSSINSNQLSLSYPSFLNYKPFYSEIKF